MAGLSEVNLSTNKCFGDTEGYAENGRLIRVHDVDKNQTGWTAFCEAFKGNKSIQTLVLSDIGIGPVGLTTLASGISAMAGMTEVRLDGNPITGSRYGEYGKERSGVEEYDCDPSGLVALLEAMKSSAVTKLDISDCDIGPKGLMTSATLISAIAGIKGKDRRQSWNQCRHAHTLKRAWSKPINR